MEAGLSAAGGGHQELPLRTLVSYDGHRRGYRGCRRVCQVMTEAFGLRLAETSNFTTRMLTEVYTHLATATINVI